MPRLVGPLGYGVVTILLLFLIVHVRSYAAPSSLLRDSHTDAVQEAQEHPPPPAVGDLGYVMQLAVKSAVTQALQDQDKINRALQDKIQGQEKAHTGEIQILKDQLQDQE